MKSSKVLERGIHMLRSHPYSAGGVVGILAVSALFMFALGITPQRIAAKVNRTAPQVIEQAQRDLKFGLAPKEVVVPQADPVPAVLPPIRTATFNGPLRVDPLNPRYFTDNSGKAIYLTGSHTWSNLQDNGGSDPPPLFDYTAYLDFLQENNHNFFRLWTWEQARWTVETADDQYRFDPMPYLRTGPGNALDGKPKFDLDQFNQAYFDRMRERVIAAGDRGIYVSIMLFDGWSIESNKGQYGMNNPWRGHPFNKDNNINNINGDPNNNNSGEEVHQDVVPAITAYQQAYVRKVIDTVGDLDNVLYEIANESNNSSEAWQYDMIDYIKSYEATKPKQHPVGMTSPWPGGYNPDLLSSPADWVSLNNADGTYMTNPPVADGTRVSLYDTDHLCGICGDRSWVWKSFTRGHNPIFMDGYDGAGYGVGGVGFNFNDPTWVSLRKNLGYTLTYANRMDLNAAVPRTDLASSGYCLAKATAQDAEYLVYLPNGGNVTVDLSDASGNLTVEWFNPQTGATFAGGSTTGGGNRVFQAPFSGDAVLYLYAGSAGAPATPTSQPNDPPGKQQYLPIMTNRSNTPAPPPSPSPSPQPSPTTPPGGFLDTFDNDPPSPEPFQSSQWDIQVHSRDIGTWQQLDSMQAAHGPNCEAPPATHLVNNRANAVYQCRNHTMTAINAGGYGVIYLTPDQIVDFSTGEAVIRFDVSTLRSSGRDWIDFWITPYDENVALPLDTDTDLQGAPRDAIRIFLDLGLTGKFRGEIYSNFASHSISQATSQGYETVLTPSAMVRSTFELRISKTHIKFGMPDYNLWWLDTSIANLGWDSGIFQIGHHSYNPTKDCGGGGQPCAPNTWHWDNVSISNARPFTIIKGDRRDYSPADAAANRTVTFDQPAPPDSHLRFAGVGRIEVSFDGGPFQLADKAQTSGLQSNYHPEHFSSYWMAVPAGTQSVRFRFSADDWYGTNFDMIAQDIAIWSVGQ
jgi:hypothetical protein